MAPAKIRDTQNIEEVVTPKQREQLDKQKKEFFTEIDVKLASIPEDSYDRPDLQRMRDNAFRRFPTFPVDLTIWKIAYYEDFLKAYQRVRDGGYDSKW
jgi:hypothetical protein